MTLLETEIIGKALVRKGYYRNPKNHHQYRSASNGTIAGSHIEISFHNTYAIHWYADIKFEMNVHTVVKYKGHSKFFTVEWLHEEGKKLRALFEFMRS